ncbi:hypothetical protein ColKHC_11215 [Colletotrichum higginsianum]|nr:hypothetical protein ColKHC_11215 [Colletotrichum higginsianum]
MQLIKATAILALAASLAAAAPGSKAGSTEKRQTTEFGPYPEDKYFEKKRQTTEFGPYPEDKYTEKKHDGVWSLSEDKYTEKKRQTTEFGPYPEDKYTEKH